MDQEYDVIVIGGRCAGSPTAMLLAQHGHRVAVVDRATFPSDTVSTHLIHAPGVAALHRWGLLDDVIATGCPPIGGYTFDFGFFTISGRARTNDGVDLAFAPRRTVLDKILVEAACDAGATVHQGFSVTDIVTTGGTVTGVRGRDRAGAEVTLRASVVIGADGRNSHLVKAVHPEEYNQKPVLQWAYYAYWRDLPVDGMHTIIRPDRGWAAIPTNDDLTLLVLGWPAAEATAYKADIEGNYLKTLELEPAFAERVRKATRVSRFAGGGVTNFFRTPFGPGWALVGDAGYNKDPITAQGITDAFHDAELCSTAVHAFLTGAESYDEAMTGYHHARDARVAPMYEFTTQLATLEPPPPEMQQLLAAAAQSQVGMDAFVSMFAGTMSPVEFFDPAHIGLIMAAAAA